MVYKCVNQLTPQIIYDKLTFNDNVKSRPTRDTGKMLLRPPHCHTSRVDGLICCVHDLEKFYSLMFFD